MEPRMESLYQPNESSTVPLQGGDGSLPPLTKAQISRASAQAVRQCIPTDALYIVNSLHFSTYGHLKDEALRILDEEQRSARLPLQQHVKFEPIDFGQSVSPRLSAHCFLHMLIRRGHSYQAAKFAQLMIGNGLKVRTFTMESVIKAVCATQNQGLHGLRRGWSHPPNNYNPRVLKISQELFSNPVHGTVFTILRLAREHGYRRSEAMYEALISACLLQGEIIVAALLFACLVKDWQLRIAAKKGERSDPANVNPDPGPSVTGEGTRQGALDRRISSSRKYIPRDSILHAPYPEVALLKKITHRIELEFGEEHSQDRDDSDLQEALQALAILAALVEEGDIHFGKISPLLRALYSAPRCGSRVWKYDGKTTVTVHAHTYFHKVLLSLVKSLKDPSTMSTSIPLDKRACNSLLHYSLRHRFSPALANTVMKYMFLERRFQPGTEVFNILLRSGTTLRRNDLSEVATQIIRRLQSKEDPEVKVDLKPHLVVALGKPNLHSKRDHLNTRFIRALRRLRYQTLRIPATVLDSSTPLKADEATVVSYITHLTAIGKAHIIVQNLFHLLPELAIVDHPSWGDLPPEEWELPKNRNRKDCLVRAVLLGPRFFAALLNALSKAGKTGLAERVWILAKYAERASWLEDFSRGVDPWYLPVAAYTSMLQAYANESRKGLPKPSLAQDGSVMWVPRSKDSVRGWARLVYRHQTMHSKAKRHDSAIAMAKLLFRSMMSGGGTVVRSLLHLEQILPKKHFNKVGAPPKPDARFFNAALNLFRPAPWMLARRPRTSPARTRRFLHWVQSRFIETGMKSSHWHPLLQEIAEAMAQDGYRMPPGFQHLFTGRHSSRAERTRIRTTDRAPYSFPRPRHRFRPHSLPTSKTRGLPVKDAQSRPLLALTALGDARPTTTYQSYHSHVVFRGFNVT